MIANPAVQELRRHHVYASALQQSGKLPFNADEVEAGDLARLELNEDIDVAVRSKIVAKHRPEQRQAA